MFFFLIAAVVTAAVILALVRPLMAAREGAPDGADFNIAVYKDQLAEIDRDVARGILSGSEAEAAKAEIGRRLLAEDRNRQQAGKTGPVRSPNMALVIALMVLVPIGAGAVYLALGSPGMPAHPFQKAGQEGAENAGAELAAAIERLRERLAQNPDNAAEWALLARSLTASDRHPEALNAYARAVDLTKGEDIRLLNEYAEAQAVVSGGMIGLEALELFKKVLEADPANIRARYYVALWKAQSGDAEGALADRKAIVRDSPPGAPWLPALRAQIAEVEPNAPEAVAPATPPSRGPSQEDMAAAANMTPEERAAMIEGMVAQLAARLQENPDNLEGWQRLAHAYRVMGRTEEAHKAFAQVLRLDPDNQTAKQALKELGQP